MKINPSLPDWFEEFLSAAGISKKNIARADAHTRFYHDLNIYGDEAEPIVEELEQRIDISSFNPNLYFPPEFPGENSFTWVAYWAIPFSHRIFKLKDKYKPLNFSDVMAALERGRWEP